MIDFRTVTVEMNTRELANIERHVDGHHVSGAFKNTGVMAGNAELRFDSNVRRAEAAIKTFHFETKNDHHIKKIKLEPNLRVLSGGRVSIGVEGVFMDNSPNDDFVNKPFIMSATLLVIVDRD